MMEVAFATIWPNSLRRAHFLLQKEIRPIVLNAAAITAFKKLIPGKNPNNK